MLMRLAVTISTTLLALTFLTNPAQAADPTALCENAKLKAAGKRDFCLGRAAGKDQLGRPSNAAKCETKFSEDLAKADANAAKKGASCRYVDNGDKTVSDLDTGLMWQKTDNLSGVTDKDKAYAWTDTTDADESDPDGSAFTTFLAGLNDCESDDGGTVIDGHAGYCDWRIPQIDELVTIIDCSFGNPCIDQSAFGQTNASAYYLSSTTLDRNTDIVWGISIGVTSVSTVNKDLPFSVRAVRGGG